jgi:phage shock protein PspC (stress-responsive transcriptional regulator)
MEKKLYRFPDQGKIAGICQGFAVYYNTDPNLLRLIMVLFLLFGPGLLIYLIAWMIIPTNYYGT